jgi:hypothetical protein
MKKWAYILLPLLVLWAACEDVIEVETPSEPPRLVVDGVIRVDTTQEFLPVAIRLTQTSNFFGEVSPVSDVERIVIILQVLEDGLPITSFTSSLAELEPGSGIYEPDPSFDADQRIRVRTVLDYDILFTLVIEHQGRRYAAQTQYVPAVAIDNLAQGTGTLFEDDETEVVVTYTDMPDVDNYYIFDFGFGNFLPTEDTFYKGQTFSFSYFYDQSFANGERVEVSLLGADLTFYNYMNLLVQQTEGQNNPFGTPVATVRGNVFDVTDLDNDQNYDNTGQPGVFPLGYFSVVQEFRDSLILQYPD